MEDTIDFDSLTVDQIRNEIIRFKNDIFSQKLDNYYATRSLGEIFGVSRKELPHSNFIAWLLNNQESHNLGTYPFKKFLEILVLSSKGNQSVKYKALFDSIITGDLQVSDLSIMTEKNLPNIGRVDLVIEANVKFFNTEKYIRLIIENKVSTKEHSDQTTKYFNYYEGLDESGVINLYVFLTPLSGIALSELEEVECSCKEYIQTNYQNLVDYLLEPILNKDTSDKTRMIIKDYLQVLSQPTQNDDEEEHKQGLIMAIGSEERELLTRFWDKNQKLIMSALYAISSDPDQDKDVRDSIGTALNSISGGEKDRSLISIFYNGKLYIENIKKSDIGFSTVMLLEAYDLIDGDVFSFLREDRSCSFLLLKLPEEFTEGEIKYGRYRANKEPELIYNNAEYYVARNWGINNIQGFIDKFSARFPGLEYRIG